MTNYDFSVNAFNSILSITGKNFGKGKGLLMARKPRGKKVC